MFRSPLALLGFLAAASVVALPTNDGAIRVYSDVKMDQVAPVNGTVTDLEKRDYGIWIDYYENLSHCDTYQGHEFIMTNTCAGNGNMYGDIGWDRTCTVTVWDEPGCKGSGWQYPALNNGVWTCMNEVSADGGWTYIQSIQVHC